MELTIDQLETTVKKVVTECLKDSSKMTLTVAECVSFTGIGRNKITELMYKENTDFPYFKVGCKYLINRDMLIKWLEKITLEARIL